MIRRRSSRMSLRTRMLWWQLAILTPLFIASMIHHLYLMPGFTRPLMNIANGITGEILMVKNQQLRLQSTTIPVNDYLVNGQSREVRQFAMERQSVEEGFNDIIGRYFKSKDEEEQIQESMYEWNEAAKLADEILKIDHHADKGNLNIKIKYFNSHIENAVGKLEQLYNLVYRRLKSEQAAAHAAHHEMHFVTISAFVVSIIISALLGSALIQSILQNLESMRKGAGQIAKGSLEHPVSAEGVNEFVQLADSFNDMAIKIQQHDAALEDLAIHDGLTGLENRRRFDFRLDDELQRLIRYNRPFSLLMLDIDHFKSINDNYGHLAGDAVLRKLAYTLKSMVRPIDYVFRYGGEEFSVIAVETDATGAFALAERIREAVAAMVFSISDGTDIRLTISIGVTTAWNRINNKEELIAQADQALYEAKEAGRNRTHRYASPESKPPDLAAIK